MHRDRAVMIVMSSYETGDHPLVVKSQANFYILEFFKAEKNKMKEVIYLCLILDMIMLG